MSRQFYSVWQHVLPFLQDAKTITHLAQCNRDLSTIYDPPYRFAKHQTCNFIFFVSCLLDDYMSAYKKYTLYCNLREIPLNQRRGNRNETLGRLLFSVVRSIYFLSNLPPWICIHSLAHHVDLYTETICQTELRAFTPHTKSLILSTPFLVSLRQTPTEFPHTWKNLETLTVNVEFLARLVFTSANCPKLKELAVSARQTDFSFSETRLLSFPSSLAILRIIFGNQFEQIPRVTNLANLLFLETLHLEWEWYSHSQNKSLNDILGYGCLPSSLRTLVLCKPPDRVPLEPNVLPSNLTTIEIKLARQSLLPTNSCILPVSLRRLMIDATYPHRPWILNSFTLPSQLECLEFGSDMDSSQISIDGLPESVCELIVPIRVLCESNAFLGKKRTLPWMYAYMVLNDDGGFSLRHKYALFTLSTIRIPNRFVSTWILPFSRFFSYLQSGEPIPNLIRAYGHAVKAVERWKNAKKSKHESIHLSKKRKRMSSENK